MALNPPLLPDGRPAGLLGEWYLLERRGIAAAIDTKDARLGVLKGAGKIIFTTVRIVFIPTRPSPTFQSFDIPLQGISSETFKQPVFGANRLEMDVAMVPGRGLESAGPIHVSLTFNEGGCNKFLRVFFALMEKFRAASSAHDPRAQAVLAQPQSFVQELEAYVDSSDPSVIYCVQAPTTAVASQPAPPPPPGMMMAQPQQDYGYATQPQPQPVYPSYAPPTGAPPAYPVPQPQPYYYAPPGGAPVPPPQQQSQQQAYGQAPPPPGYQYGLGYVTPGGYQQR